MTEELTCKIRSKDGSPIKVADLAMHIEAAGCEIVSVPLAKRHQRIERPASGWPPLRSVPTRALHWK